MLISLTDVETATLFHNAHSDGAFSNDWNETERAKFHETIGGADADALEHVITDLRRFGVDESMEKAFPMLLTARANALGTKLDAKEGNRKAKRRQWQDALLEVPDRGKDGIVIPESLKEPELTADEQWAKLRSNARSESLVDWKATQEVKDDLGTGDIRADVEARQRELENGLDNFRQNLPESRKSEYDDWVGEIADHPGIAIDRSSIDASGKQELGIAADFSTNLVYRGVGATTFHDRDILERATSTDDHNQLTFEIKDPPPDFAGLYVPETHKIVTSAPKPMNLVVEKADNLYVHEFAHAVQQGDNVPGQAAETISVRNRFDDWLLDGELAGAKQQRTPKMGCCTNTLSTSLVTTRKETRHIKGGVADLPNPTRPCRTCTSNTLTSWLRQARSFTR